MTASFSGSSSLPSSVVGESLNWYSDQESLYLRPKDVERPQAFFRVVKSHLDSPASVDASRRRRRGSSAGGGTAATRAPAKRIVVRLPPIVLHSPGGKELDTDTVYQQSIRESKARSQLGLPPMDSGEWRLPHAAVPARPDFSKRVPSLPGGGGGARKDARRRHASPSSLTAENISRLQDALAKRSTEKTLSVGSSAATPSDYSAAYGAELHWLTAGLRRIYVPFIESAPLHDKSCSPADKRTSDHEFPGWCYGCRLQNGAHWHGDPSYNPLKDRPVRVGGGFAYVTREFMQSLGDWTSAMRHVVPGLVSKDASWERSRILGAVDDAVIQALADHQAVIPDRYSKLPDIPVAWPIAEARPAARAAGPPAAAEAEQRDRPFSIVSVSTISGQRRRSVSDDSTSAHDTSQSIAGSSAWSADAQSSTAEREKERRKSRKLTIKRNPLQDMAIVPLKKHISVIREQTEMSVHRESAVTTNGQAPPEDVAMTVAPDQPLLPSLLPVHPQPPIAHQTSASSPRHLSPAMRATAVVSERSVIVPRPAGSRRPSLESGNSEKYTVRVKLIDGDKRRDASRTFSLSGAPTRSTAAPDDQQPVDQEMVEPAIIDGGAAAALDSGDLTASDTYAPISDSPLVVRPGDDDESAATNLVDPAAELPVDVADDRDDGQQSQQWTPERLSAKSGAKSDANAADSLQNTLKHALQISTWRDSQVVAVQVISDSIQQEASIPDKELTQPPAPPADAVSSAKRAATNNQAAPEEVVVQRIGKRQNERKRSVHVGRSKKTSQPTERETLRPSSQAAREQQDSATDQVIPPPQPENHVPAAASEPEAPPPDDCVPAAGATGSPAPELFSETDQQQRQASADASAILDADDAGLLEATTTEAGRASDSSSSGTGTAQNGGNISREPSMVVGPRPRRRVIISARPAKKPNFMHLLTLDTSTEVEEILASPPRSPTPDLDFDIERESPVEAPSPPSTVSSQPLPPIRYAMTPSPVPQRVVAKQPTPEPIDEAPEPIVVRQRPRKSLDAFLQSRRDAQPKRPDVIQPLTKKELKEIVDPLDYLSKYCLIRLDRLPYYEKVFREVVSYQRPRYPSAEATARAAAAAVGQETKAGAQGGEEAAASRPTLGDSALASAGKLLPLQPPPAATFEKPPPPSSHGPPTAARPPMNQRLLRSFAQLMSVPEFDEPAINIGEFHVQRITFAIRKHYERYDKLVQAAELLEAMRDRAAADIAKQKYSEVIHPPAVSEEKESRAKKSKGRAEKANGRTEAPTTTKPPKLSDSDVLQKLPQTLMDELLEDAAVRSMTIKLNRLEERIAAAEQRMAELEEERQEMERWAQEVYVAERSPSDSLADVSSDDTNILSHLRPSEDHEMNLEEVEYALRLVNNQLITQRELMYVYRILKIPGRRRINLKTFCCVSALSEKVQELDPVLRSLINAFDYDALEMKMEVCKELFYMLADKSADAIDGAISIRTLAAELIAGGISREDLNYIIRKLDFRRKGYVEYLDFLVYIPLFIEIHRRIVSNPLSDHLVTYESSQPLQAHQQSLE